MTPKVSILVPVYNASRWLRECLDSIVGQTYTNLQVVLLDDGSTDNSLAICREYADKYPFVEVYHQKNRGVAAARNALLDRVKGEYVLFVDADDWIERDAVSTIVDVLVRSKSDIVVFESTTHNEYGAMSSNAVRPNDKEEFKLWNKTQTIQAYLCHISLRGMLWNKMIKRELFEGKRFDANIGYGEDAAIVWSILQDVDLICLVDKPLYNYRVWSSSISGQKFNPNKMTALKVWEKICADTDRSYPQYSSLVRARYGAEATLLLYNATRSGSKKNENVRLLCRTISHLLPYMKHREIVSRKMYWFAMMATRYYDIVKLLVRG